MPRQNAQRVREGAGEKEKLPSPADRRPKLSDLMKDYRGWWNLPRAKAKPHAAQSQGSAAPGDSWRAA